MAFQLSTESLAAASARRPWLTIGAWALVLVAAFAAIGVYLSSATTTEVRLTNNPESQRADAILEDWRGEDHDTEVVIVRSAEFTVDDPEFEAMVDRLFADIGALGPGVIAGGTTYYESGDPSLVSGDRHISLLAFEMAGDELDADDTIDEVLAVLDTAREDERFDLLIAGGASINHDFQEVAESDLQRGEAIGIPIALVVLVLVFGALTAAIIPIILGLFSIVVAVGITALMGQAWEFNFFVTNVITMIGLAVGIDYSLFIVSRYREERARGLEKRDAIRAAGATASRAVFFSGLTVVFALLGMLIHPSTIFRSLGAGAIIVVIISVLVSLTLLPAIIGLMGDRVNSLRVPFVGRAIDRISDGSGGFWDRVTRTVMRFPALSLAAATLLLLALAIPYFDINTGAAGVSTLPHNTGSYEAYTLLQDEFNFGQVSPTEIVIQDGDITRPEVQDGIERLSGLMAQDPLFGEPSFEASPDNSTGLLSVEINADPNSTAAVDAVRNLRDEMVPQAFDGVDAEVLVTGQTASSIDYVDTTADYTPIVFVFVLGLSFVLLTVVFRSLIVPLKAMVMNLLSVGASYGALVLVFQWGVGNEIFGFQQVDIIEAWVPLWTFSILFGLSMDYHVFLLSRIRERFNRTKDNTESVAFGVRSTAGIITGAALIMASVFGGVAMGDLVDFQQMGFGLAVAVILDATIVRSVLVPAAMQLLGAANWYLPPVLRWLPELRTEGEVSRQPAAGGVEAS